MNEREIFEQALDIEPDQRASFLDQVCGDDRGQRHRIEALLRSHDEAGSFLKRPAQAESPTIEHPYAPALGSSIGPYKLLQRLGEGGMGEVYMAEQTEPVERRVAVKIIKAGMDTRQVIARFEAERQALAMMDHPNIAQVFDGGSTDTGRPYIVMELVKGVPITQYCDEHRLGVRARLELFKDVCHAVQHAHQKGIIHRDLKPSNVLVAEYDDRAVPKIIDFGVAKATQQRLTNKTMFTEVGTVVGTIEYMSPEQAKLNQLDIDTRSDIYSLGVLLYELLAGETPFDRKQLRSAAFDEMLRIIREVEPSRPSLKLSTSVSLPSIAATRDVEPRRLGMMLRGELDWIVMKALAKERSRRYQTAAGFAEDVARYLEDKAVTACPPSTIYQFRKFVNRHRAALSMVALLFLILSLGIVGTVSQARWALHERDRAVAAEEVAEQRLEQETLAREEAVRAREQAIRSRDEAITQTRRANRVVEVITDLFAAAGNDFANDPDYSVVTFLHDFADEIPTQIKDDPIIEAELRMVIGRAFKSFESYERAYQQFERALELRRSHLGELHPETIKSLVQLGWYWFHIGQAEKSESTVREALRLSKQVGDIEVQLDCLGLLVRLRPWREKLEISQDAVRLADEHGVKSNAELELRMHLVEARLASVRSQAHVLTLADYQNKLDEIRASAESLLSDLRSRQVTRSWVYLDTIRLNGKIAELYRDTGIAEQLCLEAISVAPNGRQYTARGIALTQLSRVMQLQGEEFDISQFRLSNVDLGVMYYWLSEAAIQLQADNVPEFQQLCEQLLDECSRTREGFGFLFWACNSHPLAFSDWNPILELATNNESRLPGDEQYRLLWQGAIAYRCGQFEKALSLLREAESQYEVNGAYIITKWYTTHYLALCLYALGRDEEAMTWTTTSLENRSERLYGKDSLSWALCHHVSLDRLHQELIQASSIEATDLRPGENPYLYAARGDLHMANEDNASALVDYERAVELVPSNVKLRYRHARVLFSHKNYVQTVAALDGAIRLEVAPHLYRLRGQCHAKLGSNQQAIDDFTSCLDERGSFSAFKDRAKVYFAKGNYELALQDIEKAVHLNHEDVYTIQALTPKAIANCPDHHFRERMVELSAKLMELTTKKSQAQQNHDALLRALGE